jgi:ABC-type polysaccharide/polyol phosphate transport system ATPase subunit
LTDAIARVEFSHVSKRFKRGTRADSLRELLPALGRAIIGRGAHLADSDDFWALRDVSFRVEPGEVLGVIGPNGAGKSTVLRLLTGLLAPDEGRVDVHGRIGALIELAAGFHPDLTGRENIYLQGAILGLSRADIRQRFDAIVAFAEVEAFLDTPVKRYSSGMNARLGFAIAVHAEPDVLLVDEVLSVGDRAFQAKAFGRLAEEVKRGIPVVMVSHQLERVATLCHRALLLRHGTVAFEGSARDCVDAYIDGSFTPPRDLGPCPIRLDGMDVAPTGTSHAQGTRITLAIRASVLAPLHDDITLGVRVRRMPDESHVSAVHATAGSLDLPKSGSFALAVSIVLNLGPGAYRLQCVVWHSGSKREWAQGPSTIVEVVGTDGSSGSVWLAPSMQVVSDG